MLRDEGGEAVVAGIKTYGDTIHSIIERRNYRGTVSARISEARSALSGAADRVPAHRPLRRNVELGRMNDWVDFYARVMGFRNLISFDDKDISTEYSSLMSKVMTNGNEQHQVPDQRTGAGKEEVADRRVPRVLPRPWRAAHRAGHRRHHCNRRARCAPRRRVLSCRRRPTTMSCRSASARSTRASTQLAGARRARRSRSRGLPAADLLEAGAGPPDALLRDHRAERCPKSFGKGNFKALFEAIEREQALRGQPVMPIYHTLGEIPRKRHTSFRQPERRALCRGVDGTRGLHGDVVAALPHASADDGEVGAPDPRRWRMKPIRTAR